MLNRTLLQTIENIDALRTARPLHVLQCSSQHATGAIIFHVWAGPERYPRVVIKTARNPDNGQALEREWQTVSQLQQHTNLRNLIPGPAARFELDHSVFYAYTALPGCTMFARYRNRLVIPRKMLLLRFARQALNIACALHAEGNRTVVGLVLAQDLANDLEALRAMVGALPGAIERSAQHAGAELRAADLEFPAGRIHGDFSPYNLVTNGMGPGARVGLIDWEHAEPDRPQHLDILRFISACTLMGRRRIHDPGALERMSDEQNPLRTALLSRWFARMTGANAGESPPLRHLRALWWHYWIHAARREQERQDDPRKIMAGSYLDALAHLR